MYWKRRKIIRSSFKNWIYFSKICKPYWYAAHFIIGILTQNSPIKSKYSQLKPKAWCKCWKTNISSVSDQLNTIINKFIFVILVKIELILNMLKFLMLVNLCFKNYILWILLPALFAIKLYLFYYLLYFINKKYNILLY